MRETCVVLSEAAVEFVASVAAVAFEAATALIPFSTTIVCIRRVERKIVIAVQNRCLSGESLRLCVFRQCYEHADCLKKEKKKVSVCCVYYYPAYLNTIVR